MLRSSPDTGHARRHRERWWFAPVGGLLAMSACSSSSPSGGAATTAAAATTNALVGATTTVAPPTTATPMSLQVLVFHETAGFHHDSIPAGVAALRMLGEANGFAVAATDDSAIFTDAGLSPFAAVVFLSTTGDVLDPAEQAAMERFIRSGNGFVGIHAAADTEYDWPWYGGLIGAYFDSHPAPQPGSIQVVAPEHPAMLGLPSNFVRDDEWYDFRSRPGPTVTVLATLDESSYTGGTMGAPHPITWAQEYDGGRSFYTAFGHTDGSFAEPEVRTLLANAILWAAAASAP